jgi:hypothetical protein
MAHIIGQGIERCHGGPGDTRRPGSQGAVDFFVLDESAFCRTTGFVRKGSFPANRKLLRAICRG